MKQSTGKVLMVRPAHFGSNPMTQDSNSFQAPQEGEVQAQIIPQAIAEWENLVRMLCAEGIEVKEFEDSREPNSPDAVFPNNWISFHEGGEMVIYPMYAPNRRLERRPEIIEHFSAGAYKLWDFASEMEPQNQFLEGTGSLILDRINKIAYACVSPRTSPVAFDIWCKKMGYQGFIFQAVNQEGVEIYHTNVMMSLGKSLAVVCLEAMPDPRSREALLQKLKSTGHKVVSITLDQMSAFAGNMLELEKPSGESLLVMSKQAHDSLSDTQIKAIKAHAWPLVAPVSVIEKYGGGSVRCMIAEIF